jgi:predicted dienelactone hydrolase
VGRWQIGLTYFLFFILSLLLLKKSVAHIVFRILGFLIGVILIATSILYAIGMPITELPAPSGDYIVGTTSFTVIDQSREETRTDNMKDKRELFFEVWYPAMDFANDQTSPQSLWKELYSGELDRVSFFLGYLRGIPTHSYPDAPPLSDNKYPLILFNHGLQMFTSQNTLLMEHLASNGYIVVSIAHPYESLRVNLPNAGTVLPEFITSAEKWNEAMRWIEKTSNPILAARDSIKSITSKEVRARIMLNAIKNSEMNQMVSEWTKDNRFVLDLLLLPNEKDYFFSKMVDTTRIGVMGMSIGGATAAEFCKTDNRIMAGINVDGLQYGTSNYDSLNVPFMMIYSDDGFGTNDFLQLSSKADYHEYHFLNSKHADFTDLPLVWPILRMYGQLGDIPGPRMVQLTNVVILDFWDRYLKEKSSQKFENRDYPELTISSMYRAP